MNEIKAQIEAAFADRSLLKDAAYERAVLEAIDLLDRGEQRVAEKQGDHWIVNVWLKQAILLYFGIAKIEEVSVGPYQYRDKIPLKRNLAEQGVRLVPPGTIRYGAFLERGAVVMPGYVNIGAYVGAETMVDTWATVGSCAQVGKRVHLSGGCMHDSAPPPMPVECTDIVGYSSARLTHETRRGKNAMNRFFSGPGRPASPFLMYALCFVCFAAAVSCSKTNRADDLCRYCEIFAQVTTELPPEDWSRVSSQRFTEEVGDRWSDWGWEMMGIEETVSWIEQTLPLERRGVCDPFVAYLNEGIARPLLYTTRQLCAAFNTAFSGDVDAAITTALSDSEVAWRLEGSDLRAQLLDADSRVAAIEGVPFNAEWWGESVDPCDAALAELRDE